MTTVVAVHQPNFFPWLGFFNKIISCDKFLYLDNAQFPKKGGVWTNRVRMASSLGPSWETVPIDRSKHGVQLINEVSFKGFSNWRQGFLTSLKTRYRETSHFEEIYAFVNSLLNREFEFLSEFNISAITRICEKLEISTPTVRSSSLQLDSVGSKRLCDLTAAVGGTEYLSGSGSWGYLEPTVFTEMGITLRIQSFVERAYAQKGLGQFEPRLSVIDALMNVGWKGTRQLIGQRSM